MGTTPTCTTCNSESVASARSTALRAASSASSEPSVASRILVGKMLIAALSFPVGTPSRDLCCLYQGAGSSQGSADGTTPFEKGCRGLFTRVRGSRILRTFALRSSRKLAGSGFAAAFLLQHLLAGASDLHSDEPKGGYGLLSLMPYAPKVFLVRPRAPVLFQPLVHLEDTPKHCFCPVLQLQQRCVRPAHQDYLLVAYLAWPLAFSFY